MPPGPACCPARVPSGAAGASLLSMLRFLPGGWGQPAVHARVPSGAARTSRLSVLRFLPVPLGPACCSARVPSGRLGSACCLARVPSVAAGPSLLSMLRFLPGSWGQPAVRAGVPSGHLAQHTWAGLWFHFIRACQSLQPAVYHTCIPQPWSRYQWLELSLMANILLQVKLEITLLYLWFLKKAKIACTWIKVK